MSTYDLVAGVPVQIDDYELTRLQEEVSSGFHARDDADQLRGGGEEGVGEDVTYDTVDHDLMQSAGPIHPAGRRAHPRLLLGLLSELELFPEPPAREPSRLYRNWSPTRAPALDLALRQARRPLHDVVGREAAPLTFVVSLRLGDPAALDPVSSRLALYPTLRFKLDPTASWTPSSRPMVATEAVDSLDLKGFYRGTVVDNPTDPEAYGRWAETFPDAWLEDPTSRPRASTRSCARTAIASPGTRRSTGSPTSRRCRSRRGW